MGIGNKLLETRDGKPRKTLVRRHLYNLLPDVSDQMADYYIMDRIVQEQFGGHYVIPADEDDIRYDIRSLDKYCKEIGKKPKELSKDELEKFRLN
ncbi:hypothetical protein JCM17380_50720 [Desulfosporosinus burensis]